MASELNGPPAELRMTLEITRAATGKTETVELVGHTPPEHDTADQPGNHVPPKDEA